jgi:hypothetical protein
MTRQRWYLIAMVAAAMTVGLACGDTTGIERGTLQVVLTTPNTGDGAILFSVSGAEIDNPSALGRADFLDVYAPRADSVIAVVVGGDLTGPLMTFDVRDISGRSSYRATIIEVAGEDSELRGSLDGYELSVQVAPASE